MALTLQFTVVGEDKIHCAGCEQRIGSALRRLPGVRNVRASHQTQRVVVTLDPGQAQAEQVRSRLGDIGYQVEPTGSAG